MQVDKIIVGLLCVLYGSVSHADYDAADLKKLFTDKSQRAQIDAARTGKTVPGVQQTNKVKLSGYVTRSDGKNVVWLNDTNTLENSKVGNARVHQSTVGKNKKVTVSVDGKMKRLKPGETWDKETGKVVDNH